MRIKDEGCDILVDSLIAIGNDGVQREIKKLEYPPPKRYNGTTVTLCRRIPVPQ